MNDLAIPRGPWPAGTGGDHQASGQRDVSTLSMSLPFLDLESLDKLIAGVGHEKVDIVPLAAHEGAVWFNIAAAIVNRHIRASRIATNAVEQAESAGERAILRELLVRQRIELFARLPDDEPRQVDAEARAAPTNLEAGIRSVYRQFLSRRPLESEVEKWANQITAGLPFHEFLLLVERSDEATNKAGGNAAPDLNDAKFVQQIYEFILGRGAHPRDMSDWVRGLKSGEISSRGVLLQAMFQAARAEAAATTVHDGLSCSVMGTTGTLHVSDWHSRAQGLKQGTVAPARENPHSRFYIKSKPRCMVSAIASLYRGADFIDQFMANITSQTVFDDYCELIIVDAASPENESAVIAKYLAKHKNIQYLRMNYRIGIYDAWNVGVQAANGEYLTNTNLDDLRRADSLELQAAVLDNLEFVDVTYQDFYYSFDPDLTVRETAAFGYKSELPVITPYNMMSYNSPHNAPMWRKRLHRELGLFDTAYRSAGDYEFWLRCLVAGKTFYKLNDPHVVYYQNPHGISTRADTRGVIEAKELHKRYFSRLTSPNLTTELDEFGRTALKLAHGHAGRLEGGLEARYDIVQRELRNLSRRSKFVSSGGR